MISRSARLFVSLSGLTGVGLGAFGAHALKSELTARNMVETWHTAVLYQLVHTVALVAITAWFDQAPQPSRRWLAWASNCWILGIICFSGSLYSLALGGPRWMGPITPVGGLFLLVGWAFLGVVALKRPDGMPLSR